MAGAALLVLLTARPAAAHAELVETTPAAGAALDAPPEQVELRFSEAVDAGTGAVRVFDASGERLDRGRVHRPGGDTTAVALELPDLADGSYVVTWRVLSADSHPVQGAFTFQVGEVSGGADTGALAERLLASQGGDTTVGGTYAVVRWLVFASLLVLVGGSWFVAWLWPPAAGVAAVRRLLGAAWLAAVGATALGIGLQGAYGAGLGLDAVADPTVIGDVLDTRFGRAWLARLVLLGLAAPFLAVQARRLAGRERLPDLPAAVLAAGGAAVLATTALAGHATSGRWVATAVVTDVVHLAGASVWLGGLAVLALLLHRRDPGAQQALPRFSRLALLTVAVIAASGAVQSWRQLGSLDALTGTTYGRLLTVKVALVAVMVGLAALNRSWVGRHGHRAQAGPAGDPDTGEARTDDAPTAFPDEVEAAAGPGALARLRRTVTGEVVAGLAVLAATALLVNAIPGEQALALPYDAEVAVDDDLLVDVVVDPARAGPLDVHLYTLTADGLPSPQEEVTAELSLPDRDVGPLEVPLQRAGPNHFAAYDFDLPIPGTWELEVTVRVSEVEQVDGRTDVPVR